MKYELMTVNVYGVWGAFFALKTMCSTHVHIYYYLSISFGALLLFLVLLSTRLQWVHYVMIWKTKTNAKHIQFICSLFAVVFSSSLKHCCNENIIKFFFVPYLVLHVHCAQFSTSILFYIFWWPFEWCCQCIELLTFISYSPVYSYFNEY